MVVIACSEEGCKEFYLPCLKQGEYCFTLEKELFSIRENVTLQAECSQGQWRLVSGGCAFTDKATGCKTTQLTGGALLFGSLWTGDRLSLLVVDNTMEGPKESACTDGEPGRAARACFLSLTGLSDVTIGKSQGNHLCYDGFGFLSRNHAVICRTGAGFVIKDLSANGVYLNHKRVRKAASLEFGDVIFLFGLRLVILGELLAVYAVCGRLVINERVLLPYTAFPAAGDSAGKVQGDGEACFKPSPRTEIPRLFSEPVEIEGPPPKKEAAKRPLFLTIGPAFTMMIPMLLGSVLAAAGMKERGGGGIYLYTGAVTAVSSALIGGLWAVLSAGYGKKELREQQQARSRAYQDYLVKFSEFLDRKRVEDMQMLAKAYPPAGDCLGVGADNARLWNRNFFQKDVLYCRLGIGTLPVEYKISVPKARFVLTEDPLEQEPARLKAKYENMEGAPVGVDLLEHPLIGLTGEGTETARRILVQLAANNSSADVKVAVFLREEDWKAWEFVRWLPHIWRQDREFRYLAANAAQASELCYELGTVFRSREELAGGGYTAGAHDGRNATYRGGGMLPHFVVILACATYLEEEPAAKYLLNPSREQGLTVLYLAGTEDELPNHCEYIISNDKGHGILSQLGKERMPVSFDPVGTKGIDQFFRRISSVRVKEAKEGGILTEGISFFQLFEVTAAEELDVKRRWRQNRTYENMRAPVGKRAGGADSFLDIHEKYHGPHGLVAGTTGSGKSELLQTYVLSLAVNFSPEDVNFFLIDFKGGGMANLFGGLPHMAGQITNLSGSQIRRAMISIKSENRRRQELFERYEVNSIGAYTRLYKGGAAKVPVAHLLIIIDEFAELKREEPEFMQELISVAQVGRSLGVHLILATQKPGGIVDDNIWSNARFRICLRVQDRQDSMDVLHKPDAACLTGAGRGYLQVGNDEIYEQFQAAWSGASCKTPEKKQTAVMVDRAGRPLAKQGRDKDGAEQPKGRTQLEAVVEYLAGAFAEEGMKRPFRLWLPALPERICLQELGSDGWGEAGGGWNLTAVLGRLDDPERQAQPVLAVDMGETGHIAVCGGAFSGKSTFLQTLVYSLIMRNSPEQLNLYLLDFGSRMFDAFMQAPHVGGVVHDDEPELLHQFFCMLDRMMEERRKLLAGGSYSQYQRARKGDKELPAVLVVLDNYAAFREKSDNRYEGQLIRLAREGTSFGLLFAVSCPGFGASQLPNRIADNIKNVYGLQMGDRFQYGEVLRSPAPLAIPDEGIKGRGLVCVDGRVLEFQTALCGEAENDYDRAGLIEQECSLLLARQKEQRKAVARKIPRIPDKPLLGVLLREEAYLEWKINSEALLLGYCAEDASLLGLSLPDTFCFLILGGPRTGKTNLLRVLIAQAAERGGQSIVAELEGRELEGWAAENGAAYLTEPVSLYRLWSELTPELKLRNGLKKQMEERGMEEEEIREEIRSWKPLYFFIADLASLLRTVYHPGEGVGAMSGFLETLVKKGRLHRIYFIAVLKHEDVFEVSGYGIYQHMASCRCGILMGGNPGAQRVLDFSDLPYAWQGKSLKAGNGLFTAGGDGGTKRIVVPLAKRCDRAAAKPEGSRQCKKEADWNEETAGVPDFS